VIEIYDTNKQKIMLTDSYGVGHDEQAEFLAKIDGIYYARIRQCDTQNLFCQAAYGEGTEYRLTLIMPYVIADKYESDNTIETAKPILLNPMIPESQLPPGYEWEQIHNFYASGDEDWVKFDVRKDNIYKIIVSSPGRNCDPAIDVYDSNKQPYTSKDSWGAGVEEHIEFTTNYDGIYYARIRQCNMSDPACKASYGEGTEYHVMLIMSKILFKTAIVAAVYPSIAEPVITITDNIKTPDKFQKIDTNMYKYFVIGDDIGKTYTLTTTANGYAPDSQTVSVIELGKPIPVNIYLKSLTINSCIHVNNDLSLNICANYKNTKYGFTLKSDDAQLWKMDLSTFATRQYDPGNCVYAADDFTLDMCVEFMGSLYGAVLTCTDPINFSWKINKFNQLGDFSNDGQVDLKDAILILKIIARIPVTGDINLNADVNSDKKVGLQDLIYVLQKVAGLRG
jgi:hypothetical protein